ncbi:hypothetical protein ADUPG1_009956 [Aduncisulcus paluster]|uniref:Uncharacterized protein n=1 Tax=Aduncisulcus paluster TaxID=2918883 RepID=A0ABQ5KXD8_9EUKA|nr:hypothetical protein ADUPG1_009956 [Aduncisulcus paluster]
MSKAYEYAVKDLKEQVHVHNHLINKHLEAIEQIAGASGTIGELIRALESTGMYITDDAKRYLSQCKLVGNCKHSILVDALITPDEALLEQYRQGKFLSITPSKPSTENTYQVVRHLLQEFFDGKMDDLSLLRKLDKERVTVSAEAEREIIHQARSGSSSFNRVYRLVCEGISSDIEKTPYKSHEMFDKTGVVAWGKRLDKLEKEGWDRVKPIKSHDSPAARDHGDILRWEEGKYREDPRGKRVSRTPHKYGTHSELHDALQWK